MTAATDYRPRHDWTAVRLNTTRGQLLARVVVVTAVGDAERNYIGRHREPVSS